MTDIDDSRADTIDSVRVWGAVGSHDHGRLWVEMNDGTTHWIDIKSDLASACFARPDLGASQRD